MTDQNGCICCHLHSAKLADVIESFSEILCSILWRMVAQYATEYHKFELLTLAWLEDILCSHVHKANISQVIRNLRLQESC